MQWISVDERLPDEAEEVLIWAKRIPSSQFCAMFGWVADKATDELGGDASEWKASFFGTVFEVTHWMPMPQGPEVSDV